MSNFNKTYDLIIEDIIQSVTHEELKERRKQYPNIAIKTMFDKLVKENKIIKNQDGTYDVNANIYLAGLNLTSLLDLPYKLNKINGYFTCSWNKLTSLEGCPKEVKTDFMCCDNKLTNLIGCPTKINGDFSCGENKLSNLEGCPKTVKGNFHCEIMKNAFQFKEEDIRKICKVKGKVYV